MTPLPLMIILALISSLSAKSLQQIAINKQQSQMLYGYFDYDNIKDSALIKYINEGNFEAKITLSTINKKVKLNINNSDGFTDDEIGIPYDFHLDFIEGINKGEICIVERRRSNAFANCYMFNKVYNDWIGYINIFEDQGYIEGNSFPVYTTVETKRIDPYGLVNDSLHNDAIFNVDNNKGIFKKLLRLQYSNIFSIAEALNQIPISNKTINQYDLIAQHLKQNKSYLEAIYLLEKIIEKFPDRTVAYFNLGDAYYGLGDKEKATQAYQTYIDLMKKKGWENKIPKRVIERVEAK